MPNLRDRPFFKCIFSYDIGQAAKMNTDSEVKTLFDVGLNFLMRCPDSRLTRQA